MSGNCLKHMFTKTYDNDNICFHRVLNRSRTIGCYINPNNR